MRLEFLIVNEIVSDTLKLLRAVLLLFKVGLFAFSATVFLLVSRLILVFMLVVVNRMLLIGSPATLLLTTATLLSALLALTSLVLAISFVATSSPTIVVVTASTVATKWLFLGLLLVIVLLAFALFLPLLLVGASVWLTTTATSIFSAAIASSAASPLLISFGGSFVHQFVGFRNRAQVVLDSFSGGRLGLVFASIQIHWNLR